MTITVGGLWQYPVKSMQGEAVEEIELGPGGVAGDRAYGFLDVEADRLVSAKNPKRYAEILNCRATFIDPPRVGAAPPPIRVEFGDGEVVDSDPDKISRKLSEVLGREVRLITAVAPGVPYEEVWPELEGFGPDDFYGMLQIRSAAEDENGERMLGIPPGMAAPGTLLDLAALHVLATSTLARLASYHPTGQWDARRFRPNILFDDGAGVDAAGVDAAGAPGEDSWHGSDLAIGSGPRVQVLTSTPRCVMPTLAQPGLDRDGDILRTTAKHNRRPVGELGLFACAGSYAEVVTPGTVRVGDTVSLEATIAESSALAATMEAIIAGMRSA